MVLPQHHDDHDHDQGEDAPFISDNERHERRREEEASYYRNRDLSLLIMRRVSLLAFAAVFIAMLFVYLKLENSVSWSWFAVMVPLEMVLVLYVLRSIVSIIYLPPVEVQAVYVQLYGFRPVESAICHIAVGCGSFVTSILLCCRLQNTIPMLSPVLIATPLIASCTGLCAYGAYNVFFRKEDPNLSDIDNKKRISVFRMEFTVYILSLATIVLVALKVNNSLGNANWYLILAWPLVVAVLWSLVAFALTILLGNWLYVVSRGTHAAELDSLFWVVIPNYTPALRWKALAFIAVLVVSLNIAVATLFVALIETVRLLQTNSTTYWSIFVPLLVGSLTLLCVALATEFIMTLSISQHTQASQNEDPLCSPSRGCVTCRQHVDEVLMSNSSKVHIIGAAPSDDELMCSICMSAKANAIFMPCGHGGVCYSCAQRWCFGQSLTQDQSAPSTMMYLARQSATFFRPVSAPVENAHSSSE